MSRPNILNETIEYDNGLAVTVTLRSDDHQVPPWEWSDCHGPVSGWRPVDSKQPGERILCRDGGLARFYDFAEAVKVARKEWLDVPVGCSLGQRAVELVEQDFNFLRRWCDGLWDYAYITVTLLFEGEEVARDTMSGVEYGETGYESPYSEPYANIQARQMAAYLLANRKKHLKTYRESLLETAARVPVGHDEQPDYEQQTTWPRRESMEPYRSGFGAH